MFKKVSKGIYFLSLAVAALFMVLVMILNVIPNKYLFVLVGALVAIYGLFGVVTFKVKSKVVVSFILAVEFIIGIVLGYGSYMIYETNGFFSKFSNEKDEYALYYVVVLKDSGFSKLEELDKKSVGTYSLNDSNYPKALTSISKKAVLTTQEYTVLTTIGNDLLSKKVDSIFISDFNKELLDNEIDKFKDLVKIIHTEKVVVKNKKDNKAPITSNAFNVLISGIDTNGDINKVSRSDVNIVMTVNPDTHEVLLTNIPRDMQVQLAGTTGLKDKLTHAGIYGIDMSLKTVEDFLSTEIPYYLRVNFDSLVQVVDAVGGIDITNDVAFQGRTRYFSKGSLHLTGKQALEYSRERMKMPAGDWTRGLHQEEVIKAIITKATTSTELLTNYTEILDSLSSFIQTNIPADILKKNVKKQLDTMSSWNIVNYAVSGSGYGYEETYSMPGVKLYVTYPEDASVAFGSKAINGMLSNKKYSEIK